MAEEKDEAELPLYRVDSEVHAQGKVGAVVILGGCPYRVTGYRPVAELRFELLGVGLPVHPVPGGWHPSKSPDS